MTIELATTLDLIAEQVEMTLQRLDYLHKSQKVLRYGQLFINMGLPHATWPALYYTEDTAQAREWIRQHMTDLQNWDFVNRMIDTKEHSQCPNLSGKSLSPQSATKASPFAQGITVSGMPKLSKFLADLPYSRLLEANGFRPAASASMRG